MNSLDISSSISFATLNITGKIRFQPGREPRLHQFLFFLIFLFSKFQPPSGFLFIFFIIFLICIVLTFTFIIIFIIFLFLLLLLIYIFSTSSRLYLLLITLHRIVSSRVQSSFFLFLSNGFFFLFYQILNSIIFFYL